MKRSKILILLYSCFNRNKSESLPSWVQDWREQVLEPVGFISKTISFFYRASDRPLTILSFKDYHDSSCALFLEGSIVAEVSHVWICRQPGDSSDADCAKNWTQMAIFHDEDEIRGDHGTRLEALARTLCADFREPETGSRYARGCVHK